MSVCVSDFSSHNFRPTIVGDFIFTTQIYRDNIYAKLEYQDQGQMNKMLSFASFWLHSTKSCLKVQVQMKVKVKSYSILRSDEKE